MSRWYTVHDAAELVGQSEPTIRRKIKVGDIHAFRAGSGPRAPLRIRAEELAHYLKPVRPTEKERV